jgi:ACR3 family arsenite transporter
MGFFERYLSVWVLLCIGAGILLGNIAGDIIPAISQLEYAGVNLPVALLVWAMIFPMMVQIDFSSLRDTTKNMRGLGLTLVVNWVIKPFTMALFAWAFFRVVFSGFIAPDESDQFIAGAILLGAAPCTAMVFVWSYLAKGDPNYTLVQVSVNDLVLLVAFIPIVQLLLGVSDIAIPWDVLAMSVFIFVVIPLAAGYLTNRILLKKYGKAWFAGVFIPALKPVSVVALLSTLVLLFAFQGDKITAQPFLILLIAVPLTLQTYFIYFISWAGGRFLKLSYAICAPAAMIGASNFFELAVAVAISLFGLNSGAALVTVVGVLIEVPVMLSLVWLSKRNAY